MSGFDYHSFLKAVSELPGVYRMCNIDNQVIYVGKALNLKKRLTSYFQANVSRKTASLVEAICSIEFTVVNNEVEALILERQLIASYRPRYNILLRDDKSYPYLMISNDEFPRVVSFRGKVDRQKGKFFGPYPNAYALYNFIEMSQKLFKLRNCSNTFFRNRSRPCLQFQIQRCSAPCVNRITSTTYNDDVQNLVDLLEGKNKDLLKVLQSKMDDASAAMNYEKAAEYRDAIIHLRALIEKQFVVTDRGSADIIACIVSAGISVIYILKIREGKVVSPEVLYPKNRLQHAAEQVIQAYLLETYTLGLNQDFPSEIIVNCLPSDLESVNQYFATELGKVIPIRSNVKSQKRQWLSIAQKSAEAALKTKSDGYSSHARRFDAFLETVKRSNESVETVACFDVSHTFGEETVASCVIFDRAGPNKKLYRLYNIQTAKKSDDYGAMREVFSRYFMKDKKTASIVIVDGGRGQLKQAIIAAEEEQVDVTLLGIAKDPSRKAGLEKLYIYNCGEIEEISIPPTNTVHHFIQSIRDEAHRFALAAHRRKRDKKRVGSLLENVPGIGKEKAALLLKHFGSIKTIKSSSIEDIAQVQGISKGLAQKILQFLNQNKK